MDRRTTGRPGPTRQRDRTPLIIVGGLVLVAGLAFAGTSLLLGSLDQPEATATPPGPIALASVTPPPPTSTPSPTATPLPTVAASATPAPTPAPVPLPDLFGAIGDSYTQAWSVSAAYLHDHPQFSWAVGTSGTDGVSSLLERLRGLGAAPAVVDAATSGRKMNDAPRQADLVVAASRKLAAGKTAYVTFELGTNDLCASPDPMTPPVDFETQLQTAVAILQEGLPAGSRILMLAVPDFPHFRVITQADPTARATLSESKNANLCAPYLGRYSAAAMTQANSYLSQYDASLAAACSGINATPGAAGQLHCTYDAALLAESDFTIKDMSTVDYFHPSLAGQARMADDAWQADVWASWTKS